MPVLDSQKVILVGAALGTGAVAAAAASFVRTSRRSGRNLWPREPAPIEPIIWLIGVFVLFIAPVTGAALVSLVPPSAEGVGAVGSFERQAAAQALGYGSALVVGAVLVWSLRGRARPPLRAGLSARWMDLPLAALGLALIAPIYLFVSQVSLMVSTLVNEAPSTMIKHETLEQLRENPTGVWSWLMIGAAVVGAPIVEELTYRLCLQSFFRRLIEIAGVSTRGREVWVSITCTSGLFALTHLSAAPASAIPSLFVFGMGLGIAFERTGRIGVPILMHALFNAANIAAVMTGWVG